MQQDHQLDSSWWHDAAGPSAGAYGMKGRKIPVIVSWQWEQARETHLDTAWLGGRDKTGNLLRCDWDQRVIGAAAQASSEERLLGPDDGCP